MKYPGRVAIFFGGWGVDIFSQWVEIFREGLRFSSIVSVMVKKFSGEGGKNSAGRMRFFRRVLNCLWRGEIAIFLWGEFLS